MLNLNLKFFLVVLLILSLSITSSAETTKIGVLLPITGNYATLGEDCRQGIEMGRMVHPNSNLSFIYADSQADPKVGVTEFNRLIEADKIDAAIVNRSPVGLAVNPISLKKEIPIIGLVGHEEFKVKNKFAFQFWPTPTEEGGKLAEATLARGKRKAIILTSDDDWLLTVGNGFKKVFLAGGGEIVQEELLPGSETDLSTIIIKSLAKKPDVVYMNISVGSLASGVRRLREKSPSTAIVTNFWFSKPEIIQATGIAQSEGIGLVDISLKKDNFVQSHANLKAKGDFSGLTYKCYAAFEALDQASAGTGATTSKAIYEGLSNLNRIGLMDETLEIKDRSVQFPLIYQEIRNGKAEEVR